MVFLFLFSIILNLKFKIQNLYATKTWNFKNSRSLITWCFFIVEVVFGVSFKEPFCSILGCFCLYLLYFSGKSHNQWPLFGCSCFFVFFLLSMSHCNLLASFQCRKKSKVSAVPSSQAFLKISINNTFHPSMKTTYLNLWTSKKKITNSTTGHTWKRIRTLEPFFFISFSIASRSCNLPLAFIPIPKYSTSGCPFVITCPIEESTI